MRQRIIGFDIETVGGTNPHIEGSRLYSVAWYENQKNNGVIGTDASFNTKSRELIDILEDESITLVGHNLGTFDVYYFEQYTGIKIYCKLFDTLIVQFLLDDNFHPNTLEHLASHYLGEHKYDLDTRYLERYPIEEVFAYNLQDARLSKHLYKPLNKLIKEQGIQHLVDFLHEKIPAINAIQSRGFNVDVPYLENLTEEVEEHLFHLESEIFKLTRDEHFNPRSTQQIAELMLNHFRAPILFKTRKGNPQFNVDALKTYAIEDFGNASKFCELLLEHRKYTKQLTAYLRPYRNEHLCRDGRIRASFYIARGMDSWNKTAFGTITGRLSSRNPNFQQVSKDKTIRRIFLPSTDFRLFSADHAQLEVRIAAWLSQDEVMLKAFEEDLDVHALTLVDIYNASYDVIMEELERGNEEWVDRRRVIKPFNFGMIYGGSAPTLQAQLFRDMNIRMDKSAVLKIMRDWKKVYKGYMEWYNTIAYIIETEKVVVSETGRIRTFYELDQLTGRDRVIKLKHMIRQGVNSLMQSPASDVTLCGVQALHETFDPTTFGVIATVHDSVEGEYCTLPGCLKDEVYEERIKQIMEEAPYKFFKSLGVNTEHLHLKVEVKTGMTDWSQG